MNAIHLPSPFHSRHFGHRKSFVAVLKVQMSKITALIASNHLRRPSLDMGMLSGRGSRSLTLGLRGLVEPLPLLRYCAIPSVRRYWDWAVQSTDRKRLRSRHSLRRNSPSASQLSHCFLNYDISRNKLRDEVKSATSSLMQSKRPCIVSITRSLTYWLSRERLNFGELSRAYKL